MSSGRVSRARPRYLYYGPGGVKETVTVRRVLSLPGASAMVNIRHESNSPAAHYMFALVP